MHRSALFRLVLYLIDTGLFLLGFYLAFCLRFGMEIPYFNLEPFLRLAPCIAVMVFVFFSFFDLYSHTWKRRQETLYSVAVIVFLTNVFTMSLTFMLRGFSFPRTVFLIAAVLQVFLLGLWRYLWQALLDRLEGARPVVVIGCNGCGEALAGKLEKLLGRHYRVIGVYEAAGLDEAIGMVGEAGLVCIDASLPLTERKRVLTRCLEEDLEVLLIPDFYDIALHKATLSRVEDLPVFEIESLCLAPGQQWGKRLFDLGVAALCLALAAPLLLLVALAVRCSSPGPVFYLQERVGLNGRRFKLVKFRTMVEDAERLSGPVLASENDPRVTPAGRWLRSARLDELPQLFNVLKGDMSFVGPRPERPFFVERFSREIPGYRYRLKVKPGITGLAQVLGNYDTDPAGKLKYDLFYIRNYSLLLDLQIILQTLRVVLIPEAAKGVTAGQRRLTG